MSFVTCAYVGYLTGGLRSHSSKLFGTLDLGGGSTQITLNPVNPVCALLLLNAKIKKYYQG